MKVSISLPEEDVKYLDSYARSRGIESRSAVLQKAVTLLRASELASSYADAWASWESSDEPEAWEPALPDGIAN